MIENLLGMTYKRSGADWRNWRGKRDWNDYQDTEKMVIQFNNAPPS